MFIQIYISEITYKKQPLYIAGKEAAKRIRKKESEVLEEIASKIQKARKESFRSLWKKEWEICYKNSVLSEEEKNLIYEFGVLSGFEDETVQRKMMEEQKEKWKNIRLKLQEEYKERRRIVLVLSPCLGMIMILFFL